MSWARLGAAIPFVALLGGCGSDEATAPGGFSDVGAGGAAGTKPIQGGGGAGVGGAAGSLGGGMGGTGALLGCPEAEPRIQAKILVVQGEPVGDLPGYASAFFPRATVVIPGRTCVERIEEACRIEICTQPAAVAVPCEEERRTPVDAGPLTIVGGPGTHTLTFVSGETVSITAAGAEVPAFTVSLRAPIVVAFPTLSAKMAIDRKQGLGFSWTGDAAGPVVAAFSTYVEMEGAATAKTFLVACTFEGAAPTAKIPGAALADLPAGPVSFSIYQAATTVVTAGKWDVSIGVFASTVDYGAILE